MIHLDLFSGIGGFAYAIDQVWDNVEHIFVDNDKFCQQVLNKHWPNSLMYDNIKDIAWHLQTQNIKPNGVRKTSPKSGNTGGTITGETTTSYLKSQGSEPRTVAKPNERQSSTPTAENVSAAEKRNQLFSHSTTSMETEQLSENNMELQERMAELSKRVFQKPTNFSASTATVLKEFWDNVRTRPIDIITGGFPCQPFSAAGLRKGKDDDRFLWPHMLAIIKSIRPTWVIAENVRGIINIHDGLVFQQVCTDLEAEGYEVQPLVIPAVAVNAPHRRDRVWFIAYRTSQRPDDRLNNRQERHIQSDQRLTEESKSERHGRERGATEADNITKNSLSQRSRGRNEDSRQILERQSPEVQDERPDWQSDWIEVATQFCSVDDGLPVTLDGFELSKSRNRAEQLKAYGNSIVPQVAIEIMKGIRHNDRAKT